ncbi:MAG: AAA family ATPase [Syntrophorhabdus sp.]|nr:AAA family ATPase [Syntrophorhabdus sp.]
MGRDASMFSTGDLMTLWMVASAADTANMTDEEKEEAQERGKPDRAFMKDTLMPDESVNTAGLLDYIRGEFGSLKSTFDRVRFVDTAIAADVASASWQEGEFPVAFFKLLAFFGRTPRQMAQSLEMYFAAIRLLNLDLAGKRNRLKAAERQEDVTGPFTAAELQYLRNILDTLGTKGRSLDEARREKLEGCPAWDVRDPVDKTIILSEVLPLVGWEFASLATMEERRRLIGAAVDRSGMSPGKKGYWEEAKRLLVVYGKLLVYFGQAGQDVGQGIRTLASSVGNDGQKEATLFETVTALPYGVTRKQNLDARSVMETLDRRLYAMEGVKEQIRLEVVLAGYAQGSATPAPFLLAGPPGTGKTSVAGALAEALGLPFFTVSFSGNADIITLKGSNLGWLGAVPGAFTRILVQAGCSNPVILLDEVDKAGRYGSSGDVVAVLTEVLDVTQSMRFSDQFLAGIPVDLSKAFFVATANDITLVPQFILDRCRVIEVPLYGEEDRRVIIRDYMAEQVRIQRKLPFIIDVSDDVAARIALETDSLRVAKEMLTVLLAKELEGMTGTPDRVVLNRWDPRVADRFLRKGNRARTIGFGVPSRPVAV